MKKPEDMTFAELCDTLGYIPKGRPLNINEAAAVLHVKPHTLEQNRVEGKGCLPPSYRPPGSRRVLYSERDLLVWIAKGRRVTTSEKGARQFAQQTA